MKLFRRLREWRMERRSRRYCHHDLPCGCGLRRDSKHTYHLDAQLATDPVELAYQIRRNPGVTF